MIKAQFPNLEEVGFTGAKINQAILKAGGVTFDDFSKSNQTGISRPQARGVDPFTNKRRKIWRYHPATPGGLVRRPPDGGKKSFIPLLQDENINNQHIVVRGVSEVVDLISELHSSGYTCITLFH